MDFDKLIPWDIIDCPVPQDFFGEDTLRVNLIRHGIKNNITVLQRQPEKKKWFETYYLPRALKEIKWFEDRWGEDVRRYRKKLNELLKLPLSTNVKPLKDALGKYDKRVNDMVQEDD